LPGALQGSAVAKQVRQLKPDMKIIFMSGYPSKAAVHGNGPMPDDTQIMKPASRLEVLAAIPKELDF